jgi:hypothetical protein
MRTTEDFEKNLEVLCGAVQQNGTKLNKTQAVQIAVELLADMYRRAWDYDDVRDGYAPKIYSYRYSKDNGDPQWVPTVPELNMTEQVL